MVTLVPSTRRRTASVPSRTIIPDEVLQDDIDANILDQDGGTLVVEFGSVIEQQRIYRIAPPIRPGDKRTTTL